MDKSHLQLAAQDLDAEILRLSAIRDSLHALMNGAGNFTAAVPSKPTAATAKVSGSKGYWAAMTPLQRKREMARRKEVADKNKRKG